MRLFTLFPNLITKESYNWWVTRIFWGFRQQISKAKYLKISQNIGGKYQEASGEHRSTVQNCLRNSPFLSSVRIPDVNIRVEVAAAGCKSFQICGPNALRWCIRTHCLGILLAWIPNNSPQFQICFGDQNTKT